MDSDHSTSNRELGSDSEPEQRNEAVEALRADILAHFHRLDLPTLSDNGRGPLPKPLVRRIHAYQRTENYLREYNAFGHRWERLLAHFADGSEVKPSAMRPELVPVPGEGEISYLFRFASLLWSVPVSRGYGRRMRYLVRDRANGKLIGLFALGDPVFNLSTRDAWIGWDVNARRERLVNVMDAYVVGAVPPYSQLLGGKLVASLISSAEVNRQFRERYAKSTGLISGKSKDPHLVLVTVTSALGRSSLYNRLKLRSQDDSNPDEPLIELTKIGETQGFGHFHLSNELFERLRAVLQDEGHPYADGHQYGQGPNWRLRVMRVGFDRLGLDQDLARHGIAREVYVMPLARNTREFLLGQDKTPDLDRPSLETINMAALDRWIVPRASRRTEYQEFKKQSILELIKPAELSDETEQAGVTRSRAEQANLPGMSS